MTDNNKLALVSKSPARNLALWSLIFSLAYPLYLLCGYLLSLVGIQDGRDPGGWVLNLVYPIFIAGMSGIVFAPILAVTAVIKTAKSRLKDKPSFVYALLATVISFSATALMIYMLFNYEGSL